MINAVMLSYSKDAEIYAMTRDAIRSLKADADVFLVLVETNDKLESEPWYTEPYAADRVVFKPDFKFNQSLAFGRSFCAIKPDGYFLVLNNDIVVFPGAIAAMVEQLKQNAPFDCVSAKSYITEVQKPLAGIVEGYHAGRTFSGWAWMCRESIFAEVPFGFYFPAKFCFWYQDNYFLDMLNLHRKRHALVCDARIDHLESRSHRLLSNPQEMTYGQERVYRGNDAR